MRFIILFNLFMSLFSMETKRFIENSNVPLCKNCVYFKPYKHPEHYDLGRCTKFGKMDIISGNIDYEYAYQCRNNEKCCGFNGTYFEERKYPDITLSILQNEW